MVLVQAFLSIDWTRCSIEIALDGSTRIVRRRPEQKDGINIWLASSQVNAAHNVAHEIVAACRTALSKVTGRLPEALSHALREQWVPDKDKRLQEALSAPTPPIVASEAPPAVTLPMEADTSTAAAASAAPSPAPYDSSGGSMYQVPVPPKSSLPAFDTTAFDGSQRPVPPTSWVPPAVTPWSTWSMQTRQPPPIPSPRFQAAEIPAAPPLPQPPLTEESLAVGEFAVNGGGESTRVIIWDSPGATDNSPVVAYFPGSNGWKQPNQPDTWVPPVPCRMVLFDLGGKGRFQTRAADSFKRLLPEMALAGLRILRQWADSAHRKVILMGWSRGASWALRVAVLEAELLDAVWAFAAYPTTYGWDVQDLPLTMS